MGLIFHKPWFVQLISGVFLYSAMVSVIIQSNTAKLRPYAGLNSPLVTRTSLCPANYMSMLEGLPVRTCCFDIIVLFKFRK